MKLSAITTSSSFIACILAGSMIAAPNLLAESSDSSHQNAANVSWDKTDEISVSGSVSALVAAHVASVPTGLNLRISSTRGDLYANFGSHLDSALTKRLAPGQVITCAGLIKSYNGGDYLLVQNFNLEGQTFIVRNSHGIPLMKVSSNLQSSRVRQGSFGGAR